MISTRIAVRMLIVSFAIVISALLVQSAGATKFSGTVKVKITLKDGTTTVVPAANGEVYVQNAQNGVMATKGPVFLSALGEFSIEIEPGMYKVSAGYSDRSSGSNPYPCAFDFYTDGDGLTTNFTMAQGVQIGAESVNLKFLMDGEMGQCVIAECVPTVAYLAGYVLDALTREGVTGIEVYRVDPERALSVRYATTGVDGAFGGEWKECGAGGLWKVRFDDPAGYYTPRFYGAQGADVFAEGATVDTVLANQTVILELMGETPEDAVEAIIEEIEAIGADSGGMTNTLQLALTVLGDENPNNDRAACGTLGATANQIDAQVSKGVLDEVTASSILEDIKSARAALDCR